MSESHLKNVLIIFVKYPQEGKVKTRLADDLGEERATEIYSYMAETIIKNVSPSGRYRTAIFFDPPERETEIRKWIGGKHGDSFIPQKGNDLGEKISNAFESVFSGGADKAVIIGTDCVEVSEETVKDAFDSLDETDAVIGPAEDGGYYLLGLKSYAPEIFRDIAWSTDRVLDQSIERINERGLSLKLLETLTDIDTVNDLSSYHEYLIEIQENE